MVGGADMPFYDVRISKKLCEEQKKKLAEELEQSILLLPGKIPEGVQLEIRDECDMRFGCQKTDTAYIDLKIFGHYEESIYERVTERLVQYLENVLAIRNDKTYITYTELEHWGVKKR